MKKSVASRRCALSGPLLLGAFGLMMSACGGGDTAESVAGADVGAVSTTETGERDSDATDAPSVETTDQTTPDADATEVADEVDLDTPPEPDASATAADHPGFEWAFEEGYQVAVGYGRTDYYDPSTVADPGSMAGLNAAEAYRDGFALGLAEYAAEMAAEEARTATVLDATIVGKVIKQGVGEDWVATTAGVDEECGALVEASNPGVHCIARWLNAERGDVIAVRLGDSGTEIDIAMLVDVVQGGREVLEWWSRADGEPLPDWALPWDGIPTYLQ